MMKIAHAPNFVLLYLFLCVGLVPAQEIYHVDAQTGSDTHDGSAAAPWRTIEKARESLRLLKKEGKFPESGVVVELSGQFALPLGGVEFSVADSGLSADAPMIYRASKSGALFVGGNQLAADKFRPVQDPETRNRLKPVAREKILEFPLAEAGIPKIDPLPDKFQKWPYVELFCDDKPMQIARFPNEGWLEVGKVHDRGVAPVDRTKDEWEFGVRGGVFEFAEEAPARWNVSKGVWLNGFWCHDWYVETLRVGAIDAEKKTITTAVPSVYGIGNSSAWHTAKRRYYALNLLEELDAPGEWYIDNEKNILYFYPPEESLENVFLAVQKQPLLKVRGAKFFQIDGIHAKCTLGLAIEMRDCEDALIKNVVVYNVANNAINISGGRRCGITHSEIFNAGSNGVSLYGGNRKTLEKCEHFVTFCRIHHCGRLQRTGGGTCLYFGGCGCYIAHNLLYDTPYNCVNYGGNEHLFEFNEVHSTMMESGDGGGLYTGRDWGSLGNVIQYNFFHHFGKAGVDWQNENGIAPKYEPLKQNVMVMGVYLDDCDSGDTLRGNVFYRAGWAAFVGGGRYNTIENNLFIECSAAVHFDDRGLRRARPGEGVKNGWDLLKKLQDLGYQQSPWKEKYPFIQDIMEDDPKLPLHNTVKNNIAIGCGRWLQLHNYTGTSQVVPRLDFRNNHVFNWTSDAEKSLFPPNEDGSSRTEFRPETLTLSDDCAKVQAEALRLVPDFIPIPLGNIGIQGK
ncbi:MAG: right-handed parallel beta-helix repeat-containing protein [Planctomycetia bacterium]|nr:right-handed parallel beta-helix repeat-containing protein [Planctomycetia bacterium]